MVDLVIRGDTVVTPQGVGAHDIADRRRGYRRRRAPGSFAVAGRRAGDRRHRQDRHPRRHRSACALQMAPAESRRHRRPDRAPRRRQQGGGAWRHHHDDRLHPRLPGQANVRDAIEQREADWKGHCACDYAQHIMVEGALPVDLPGQVGEAIQAGFPTVKIFTTDITPSRKGRMVDFGDIWEIFKVLAANQGPRRDPFRGQRHCHAHVCQADPGRPHRVREHGRGAQHAVRGRFVPPRDPAGGEGARARRFT